MTPRAKKEVLTLGSLALLGMLGAWAWLRRKPAVATETTAAPPPAPASTGPAPRYAAPLSSYSNRTTVDTAIRAAAARAAETIR